MPLPSPPGGRGPAAQEIQDYRLFPVSEIRKVAHSNQSKGNSACHSSEVSHFFSLKVSLSVCKIRRPLYQEVMVNW